jgi:RNA polymerase sigma-70 factor, ECF subfamily
MLILLKIAYRKTTWGTRMNTGELEQKIKSGIKRGDTDTFKLLYKLYYPGLCVLACRYTGKPEIAEEIVQETFMKIWEGRKQIEIKGGLHSYLFATVRNSSLNYLKHQMVERKFSAKKARELQQAINFMQVSAEDGSSLLISEEMEKNLQEALDSLPPKCREIFLLHRNDEMKYSEIAEKLNISKNTVQRQISIALEKLRKKLLPNKEL